MNKFTPRFGVIVKFPVSKTGATAAKRIAVGMAPAHLVKTTHDRGVAIASARDSLRRAAAAGITMGKASVILLDQHAVDGMSANGIPHPEANFIIASGLVMDDGPHLLS